MSSELQYAVHNVRTPRNSDALPAATADLQWVGNTATLVYGERDAVLIDTHTTTDQNAALVEWVRSFGKRLTHVYITHGHGDHLFGVKQVLDAFPGVQAVATSSTVDESVGQASPQVFDALWEPMFPGLIARPPVLPTVLEGDVILLEGHRLEIIETGVTDTRGTTAVWVPDVRLAVAGDVAYDDTHPYLLETARDTRQAWLAAIERLQALDPSAVVAGHKNPEHHDDPAILDETAQYLRDFDRMSDTSTTAEQLFAAMLDLYPRRINPGILWMSAGAAKAA